MIALDTCAWIALFRCEDTAEAYQKALRGADVIVPTPCVHEVYRHLRSILGDESLAELAVTSMASYRCAPLTIEAAEMAARIEEPPHLSACDRFVYAIARTHNATLWTHDPDLKVLPQVHCIA